MLYLSNGCGSQLLPETCRLLALVIICVYNALDKKDFGISLIELFLPGLLLNQSLVFHVYSNNCNG